MDQGETHDRNGDSRPSAGGHEADTAPEAPRGVEELIAPFFKDSTLWPVLLVVVGCLSTLGSVVLVGALYHFNPLAAAALLGISWIAFDVCKRHRRQHGAMGRLGWSIVSLFGLSAAIALLAIRLGLA